MYRYATLVVSLVFCFVFPLLPAVAQECPLPPAFDHAAQYSIALYVSPDGDDQNDGSPTSPFRTLQQAARNATPGTDIILLPGDHVPGQFLTALQGTESQPIRIRGQVREEVRFVGGSEAIHLVDTSYVVLGSLTVVGASGNGINIDDGGSYDTPAHHVVLRDLHVKDIGPSGNRDGIKLSGLDDFRIEDCVIERAGSSGSGIDMVGCHHGVITRTLLKEMGSSGIQAKGGTSHILIYACRFESAGVRAINMGGSTGLAFFRPMDAPYEAANISAWANTFVDGDTPIAFVGCENGLFAHNVVIHPRRWAARILQETVGDRFVPCRNSVLANNVFILSSEVNTLVNVGPNTEAETFRFYHNAWLREEHPLASLSLPGEERHSLVGIDPRFRHAYDNLRLLPESPLLSAGLSMSEAIDGFAIQKPGVGDVEGRCFSSQPDIGLYQSTTGFFSDE